MILYYDTSALIKRYVEEDGTEAVDSLWSASPDRATSVVAFAEAVAAFSRKFREGVLTEKEYTDTLRLFRADFDTLILMSVSTALNPVIERLVQRYPLRGFDVIHLSSAIALSNSSGWPVQFACFDHALNEAALSEHLTVATQG